MAPTIPLTMPERSYSPVIATLYFPHFSLIDLEYLSAVKSLWLFSTYANSLLLSSMAYSCFNSRAIFVILQSSLSSSLRYNFSRILSSSPSIPLYSLNISTDSYIVTYLVKFMRFSYPSAGIPLLSARPTRYL